MDRNVILVTVDSLRADHCGYAGGKSLTPNLDALADDGVAFTDAVAPGPKTPESMPAIVTGRHQRADGSGTGVDDWRRVVRPHVGARETLAERFSRAGYATVGFSPNGFSSSFFGFDAGFDRFEDFLDEDIRPGKRVPGPVRGLIKWVRSEGNWKHWEGYYDEVIASLSEADEPYFLWLFLMDVHSPYLPPPSRRRGTLPGLLYANLRADAAVESAGVERRLRRAYEDVVRYADDCLGRLLGDAPGDPVVCVHADHGEAFGEHGSYGHERHLYRENLDVPFVVGGVEDAATVDHPVSLVELPSLLTAAADGTLGERVADLDPGRPVVSKSGEGGRIAVQLGRWKFLRGPGEVELYDSSRDPGERTNLADRRPDVRRALEAYADRHRRGEREERQIRAAARAVRAEGRTARSSGQT